MKKILLGILILIFIGCNNNDEIKVDPAIYTKEHPGIICKAIDEHGVSESYFKDGEYIFSKLRVKFKCTDGKEITYDF